VRKCHLFFKEGRTKLHDKVQGGRPSLVKNDLKEKRNKKMVNVEKQFNLGINMLP